MIFLVILVISMVTTYLVLCGPPSLPSLKKHSVKIIESGPELSNVANEVLKLYNRLPVEHQFGDIKSILHALDVSCEIAGNPKAQHFNRWAGSGHDYYEFTWEGRALNCYHNEGRCNFYGYIKLKNQIQKVLFEVAEQERLLKVAEVQGDLDMVDSLMQHLDTERRCLVESNQSIKATITEV
jgi:hypothetical protein